MTLLCSAPHKSLRAAESNSSSPQSFSHNHRHTQTHTHTHTHIVVATDDLAHDPTSEPSEDEQDEQIQSLADLGMSLADLQPEQPRGPQPRALRAFYGLDAPPIPPARIPAPSRAPIARGDSEARATGPGSSTRQPSLCANLGEAELQGRAPAKVPLQTTAQDVLGAFIRQDAPSLARHGTAHVDVESECSDANGKLDASLALPMTSRASSVSSSTRSSCRSDKGPIAPSPGSPHSTPPLHTLVNALTSAEVTEQVPINTHITSTSHLYILLHSLSTHTCLAYFCMHSQPMLASSFLFSSFLFSSFSLSHSLFLPVSLSFSLSHSLTPCLTL